MVASVDKIYIIKSSIGRKSSLGGQIIYCKREFRWTKYIPKSSFGRQNYKK